MDLDVLRSSGNDCPGQGLLQIIDHQNKTFSNDTLTIDTTKVLAVSTEFMYFLNSNNIRCGICTFSSSNLET